ncbi:hypothetical protein [Streptomyces carminius]|uniref:hypothetical protein n=1 Tax=Streptomyces carminius TaxID=2665496 RepID=UPI0011B413A0|nr:hypothetical protein [Streptomyces carminius]
MAREVSDPRGWAAVEWDEHLKKERPETPRGFPFRELDEAAMATHLNEVCGNSAAQLLVAITDQWFRVSNISDFTTKREELLAKAKVILSRFQPDCSYYTNAGAARQEHSPDFFKKAPSGATFTEYIMDAGLVAVSDYEVGAFWGFNAD